jgi:hypothetical protein
VAASTSAASYSILGALTGGKVEKVNRKSGGEDGEEAVSEGDLEEDVESWLIDKCFAHRRPQSS